MQQHLLKNIKPDKTKALMLAKRQLPELVCDAVNLEGIPMTLPEVQTLLDGVTVGGHKISDELITLNQAEAWRFLFHEIKENRFSLNKRFVCDIHKIAAKEEALRWGEFRDGHVTISGTTYQPPAAEKLDELWQSITQIATSPDCDTIYNHAIGLFLDMARIQFFYDVNKRTGRFMMNGFLLSAGYPIINLPAKHQLQFNEFMLQFYTSGDKQAMITFMKSCLNPRIIEIMSS